VGARAGAVREVARATRRRETPGEQPVSRRRVAGRVLHTSEGPGRPITVDRPKVEGGRVAAERRHVPVRSRPAGRMPTRSWRPRGRSGFTWRRGERSPSSRMLARSGRNGPQGHEVPRLDRRKALEGRSPGEQRPWNVASAAPAVRLRGGIKASKQPKPERRYAQVGGQGQGAGEADGCARARAVETVSELRWGTRPPRREARASVKPGVKRPGSSPGIDGRWRTAREQSDAERRTRPRRGARL
jgi:hypothetical protein